MTRAEQKRSNEIYRDNPSDVEENQRTNPKKYRL